MYTNHPQYQCVTIQIIDETVLVSSIQVAHDDSTSEVQQEGASFEWPVKWAEQPEQSDQS